MKKISCFKASTLLAAIIAAPLYSHNRDECNNWYLMPKIGIAPGIFAHPGYIRQISPLGGNLEGQSAVTCTQIGSTTFPALVEANTKNVFQLRTNGMPGFSEVYHNPILHVGFELGRNVCRNIQLYFEFTYDRATSKNYCEAPIVTSSPDGCATGCNANEPLAATHELLLKLDNYRAYGAFVGARYFCDTTFFCDRISPWIGFKTGFLHRKSIGACASIPEFITEVPNVGEYTVSAIDNFSATAFCKGTAVAGGISLGFDYCLTDCLTLLFGFEVLASAPFNSNSNVILPFDETPTPIGTAPVLPIEVFHLPTNLVTGSTGTFVQFPIWVGLQWEFDFCKLIC